MRRHRHYDVGWMGGGLNCLCASVLALLCYCSAACAQTNAVPPSLKTFAAPELDLRPLDTDLNLEPAPTLDLVRAETPAPTNRLERAFDQKLLERLDQAGYFNPPPPPPDSPVLRWADATFRPEEVQLGKKAKLSCSFYTAVKRKNPFCLLNPLFFHLSW